MLPLFPAVRVAPAGNWTILQTSSAVCPSPDCQCANGEGLPGTHGKTPGTLIPMAPTRPRSRPMASKKEIKKKIAARQAKIAKHESKIKKLKKALK